MIQVPDFNDVTAARARIAGHAVVTPLINNAELDRRTGGRILCKAENMQHVGAFKFRGAYNRLCMIPEADRARGVVACSSGNHAQGVAEAARLLGMSATIVMPADSPRLKLERTERSGAKIVRYDRASEDREAIANAIAAETGATFVHPYDDAGIIAGQGTLGAEMVEQAQAMGLMPDLVLVSAAGGGMASGVALALEAMAPECELHTVEPAGFDDYARSLLAEERQFNATSSGSICDALLANGPGKIGFEIMRRRASAGLVISDDEALQAVAFAFHELKQVVEPGGAAALAAVLSGKIDVAGKTVGVVLSGGNIDPDMLVNALRPR
ncbi:MAG: pyridoxal-5'-phosphate-dependent protein [Hirschia sp.]|nr:pyridoxal-5'-phosphate-dependent protein [Hirschia sp.]MBF17040.1 pyridoxal-5'-phosphate-dependent protein [Hirschia sp.]